MKKDRFEIWAYSNEIIAFVVFDCRLANRINKVTGYYPRTYRFKSGEEPLFLISRQYLGVVLDAIKGGIDRDYVFQYCVQIMDQIEIRRST